MDAARDIFVTASNKVIEVTSAGVNNTVATITNAGTSLQGIVVKHNGLLAVCDSGNNGIWLINPALQMPTPSSPDFMAPAILLRANNMPPATRPNSSSPWEWPKRVTAR